METVYVVLFVVVLAVAAYVLFFSPKTKAEAPIQEAMGSENPSQDTTKDVFHTFTINSTPTGAHLATLMGADSLAVGGKLVTPTGDQALNQARLFVKGQQTDGFLTMDEAIKSTSRGALLQFPDGRYFVYPNPKITDATYESYLAGGCRFIRVV